MSIAIAAANELNGLDSITINLDINLTGTYALWSVTCHKKASFIFQKCFLTHEAKASSVFADSIA